MRLAQAVGTQFDTSVVAAFEAILATSDEDYRLGIRPDFDFSSGGVARQERSMPAAVAAVGLA
jgi:hypothetical protein